MMAKSAALAGLLVLLVCSGCSGPTTSTGYVNFSGTWEGSAQQTGSPNPSIRLEIQHEQESLTGTMNSGDGTFVDAGISDTRIENGQLQFHVVANGGTAYHDHLFLFTVRRQQEKLEGTWTDILEGAQGPFALHRMTSKK